MPALPLVSQYADEMRVRQYSPVTIRDRLAVLHRLTLFTGRPLAACTPDELRGFQSTFAHLSPASVNVYSRHLRAFFDWAAKRRLIAENPCLDFVIPRVPKGRPHPTATEDLRLIFSCTRGALRMAYVLATFTGLRRGEICRLQRHDLSLGADATALIHGKGRKERLAPLLPPVVYELHEYGLPRTGWVVLRDGRRYEPERLSVDSHYHLRGLGVQTTLHSMRGAFATGAAQVTRDPLFVRDLLGHESVLTTEIYMGTSMKDAHARLAGLTDAAESILGPPRGHLRSVRESGA
ncbi:MAG TPA: tyrosine-type recombinase/integrase [Frankiaceae bacterium]|jgi:integrase/recombinase XerC|nr:tyrosine-type recombinase/integrase [Frankiaceae bacterium]